MGKQIGTWLRTEREKRNITQVAMARHIGVEAPQCVSNLERGINPIPVNRIAKIAQVFGVKRTAIVGRIVAEFKSDLMAELKTAGKKRTMRTATEVRKSPTKLRASAKRTTRTVARKKATTARPRTTKRAKRA